MIVKNQFGIFTSKGPIFALISHGGMAHAKHHFGAFEAESFYHAVVKTLQGNGIQPPSMLLACDRQFGPKDIPIIVPRFDDVQKDIPVLGFPSLLNTIGVKNGCLFVDEEAMIASAGPQHEQYVTSSPFSDPQNTSPERIDMVCELFNCPGEYQQLVDEQLINQINIVED